jgi:raffinose synthase
MRNLIRMIFVFVFVFSVFLEAGTQKLKIKCNGANLNILYNGQSRLTGCAPMFQNKNLSVTKVKAQKGKYIFESESKPVMVDCKESTDATVVSFFISPNGNQSNDGKDFLGLSFENIHDLKEGVTIWRYKPWNSWTKPIRLNNINEMEDWDIQFFYWKCEDGLYGAAVPLSGQGYRTTLGQEKGKFGAKSVSYYDGMKKENIPVLTIGFGKEPFELFEKVYEEALTQMGKKNDLVKYKKFPEIFENIGWCTWNSSDMGKKLNEEFLLNSAKSFYDASFPLKYIIVDDGWFDATNNKLNTFVPNKEKFPIGFSSVINKLKNEYGIANVGVWHAFNAYWKGINPESELRIKYSKDIFSWKENINDAGKLPDYKTYWFVSPNSSAINKFYDEFHSSIKQQGFSFLKVDNQLSVEKMCVNNFPIWYCAEKMHEALNNSAAKYFKNTIINCMDMTADAYFNFGSTSVARAVEDYFPYKNDENYNLQRGNAAAHVLQAVYNSIYFSKMVFPDFDMFESGNPNGTFHAVARAINNGPVYITDKVGEQKFDVLRPLVFSDGKILRADKALMPTEDCLFQIQDPKPFKTFSMDGKVGLLGIFNCADADNVEGSFKPSDVNKIEGEKFGVYEYFSKTLKLKNLNENETVSLDRLGCKLYYIVPLVEGNGVIGLVDKYNAPKAVLKSSVGKRKITVTLYEGGEFAAVTRTKPASVKANGKEVAFKFVNNLVLVDIPIEKSKRVNVEMNLE